MYVSLRDSLSTCVTILYTSNTSALFTIETSKVAHANSVGHLDFFIIIVFGYSYFKNIANFCLFVWL